MNEQYTTFTQELYAASPDAVRLSISSIDQARRTYSDYVDFVTRCTSDRSASGDMLDVGCGNGWSTYFFARAGFHATGVDLHVHGFQATSHERLVLKTATALELPFHAESFDVVASYQALEHVPNPEKALDEMIRVCRPGGTICIVGPNLVSPWNNIKALSIWTWRSRPIKRIFIRYQDTPTHPAGNTIFEAIGQLGVTILRLTMKLRQRGYTFTMRTPDTRPPFYADNDACYLCNPVDLMRFFQARGLEVVKVGAWGRPRWTDLLSGGTWIAARKPNSPPI